MQPPRSVLRLALAAALAGHGVSFAQDDPPKPAKAAGEKPAERPAAPAPDAAADAASDKQAREILAKAAERQNAGDLVEPGKLESFHVVFHRAQFQTTKTDKDGAATTTLVEADDDGLVVDWKQGSIKTQFTEQASTTTKAWSEPKSGGWINDGKTTSALVGEDRKTDRDQLMFQRDVIDRLLDVAILGKLVRGPGRWRVLPGDAAHPNTVAVERIASADAPELTLWIEHPSQNEYGDVVHAAMAPTQPDGAAILFDLSYRAVDDELTKGMIVRRGPDGGVVPAGLRFPFKVETFEKRPGDKERVKVLEVAAPRISLNTVSDADFDPPKVRRSK